MEIVGLREDEITQRVQAITMDVTSERLYQEERFGPPLNKNPIWLTILMEEVGEVATDILEMSWVSPAGGTYDDRATRETLRAELVQVAAVAFAWIEGLDYFTDIVMDAKVGAA